MIETRAFLLAAGRGVRFRPVTERLPKPLAPFLNVPLARAHLRRLLEAGISHAAVNLHHLGDEIVKDLVDHSPELPKLRFFPEPEILGTAGGLRNAAPFLSGADFLVVNSDAAIEPDYGALLRSHRETGRAATLLVVENREPDRYTPLQSEGDRITGFGRAAARAAAPPPLLYTGVCVLAPRLLARIPPGETSLVADLWEPLLEEGREEIGWMRHEGPFADLGSPRDFQRATLEALARGGPFPPGAGVFDGATRVLALRPGDGFAATDSVLGASPVGSGARIESCAVWTGCDVGAGASLTRCLAASGRVAPGTTAADALLWGRPGEDAALFPLH
ncbi:MAG TPA: sugar phosphate nucleotidyltransferase [Thermoanaerobaculia bacterium]|nr:sugar phosphate nucleotidyltransferase [Thermoanaerobaculia bacterium]